MDMIETKMGSLRLWTPAEDKIKDDGIADHSLTPPEKIRRDKLDRLLTDKAEVKADLCHHCHSRVPIAWVREVQFDVMEQDARIDHAVVTTENYTGPIPGFCFVCIADGPALLAQAVYFDQTPMQWGLKPTRWHLVYTDGTKTGGPALQIDPTQQQPDIIQESQHAKS